MTSASLASLPVLKTPMLLGMLEYAFAPRSFAARNARRLGRVYRVRGAHGELVWSDPAVADSWLSEYQAATSPSRRS
jgi:hypothetical protein